MQAEANWSRYDLLVTALKWIARYWPYILIAICLIGLAYRIAVGRF
jgi:hypothetical protein